MRNEQFKTVGKFSEQARSQLFATLTRIYQPEPSSAWLDDLLGQLDSAEATRPVNSTAVVQPITE
jgi:hypothetical protein